MTQIKLRRDTSAAFASSNPILGNGEPAYETDTKKLKIGDGTTAYTQLEYFSAGGGGSTNISATLPLKIVDGAISLEVDGQTIQVVDGKLHANLDELGNEVNTLAGRVTTVEGEVAKKEDEITALEPITLEKKVISNLNGMLYTSDGTRLYAQSITQLALGANWVSPNITYNNPVSYIDIPLDINKDQVITIPRFSTSYSYSQATTFMLGSYDANGLFYPIFFQAEGNSNNGWCWLISNNYPEAVGTTYLNGSNTRGSYFGALNVSSDKVYIQAKYDESSGFYIRTFGAYPDDSSSEGLQIVYTNPADIGRLRQITACRFINMDKMNKASTAISVTLFGRYDGAHLERGTLPDLTNIPNSFSLTDVQSVNYMQLNIGDGLSVVDGKLTASSTAPDKETIMGYIMPDYSTRTEVPWGTDNTAPTDGYVEVFGQGDGNTSAFVLEYTINGVRTAVSSCYATAANTNFRLPVICPKGTVYRATKGAAGHDLHFISMKGAV